jgi:hypothetical protein
VRPLALGEQPGRESRKHLEGRGKAKHMLPPSMVKRVGQKGTFACLLSVLESSQMHQFTIHET